MGSEPRATGGTFTSDSGGHVQEVVRQAHEELRQLFKQRGEQRVGTARAVRQVNDFQEISVVPTRQLRGMPHVLLLRTGASLFLGRFE